MTEPTIVFEKHGYELLHLPSNGMNAQGIVYLQVRPMTMKEEKILLNKTLLKQNKQNDALFEACVGKGITKDKQEIDVDLSRLPMEDEFALLLFLRAISYGRKYNTKIKCPDCGKEHAVSIDLELDTFVTYADENTPPKIEVVLPVCGKRVVMRYPERRDEGDSILDIIPKLIEEVEGVDKSLISVWLETLIAGDIAELRNKANNLPYGVNKTFKFYCTNPNCEKEGEEQDLPLPVTTDFFRL